MVKASKISKREAQEKLKWAFADASLRNPNNPFKAAIYVANGDTVAALSILEAWGNDPQVFQMKKALVEEHGEEEFLPTKEQLISDVLSRAHSERDTGDYVKLMQLAFDAMGHTGKAAQKPSVVVNQTNNKIMQIPVMIDQSGKSCSDDEWEKSLRNQQKRLVVGDVG